MSPANPVTVTLLRGSDSKSSEGRGNLGNPGDGGSTRKTRGFCWKEVGSHQRKTWGIWSTSSGFQKNRSFDVTEDGGFWSFATNNKAESWTIQPIYTMIHVVHSAKRINLMPSLGYQIVYPRAWDDPQELFMFLRGSKQAVSQK